MTPLESIEAGGLPFLAVGKDELHGSPKVQEGDWIEHRLPTGEWVRAQIEYGEKILEGGALEKSGLLGFYSLGDQSYVAAIKGSLLKRDDLRIASILGEA